MTATEKLAEERDELKNARIERILLSAFSLFSHNGIDAIAMTDIAKNAEIGVASLYRYFETKDEIAIRTAMWAWESQKKLIVPILDSQDFNKLNGFNQLDQILRLFFKLYQTEPDFFRFIYFFDAYVVCQQIPAERLLPYQEIILSVQKIIAGAIHKGIEDGSIASRYRDSEEELYFSIMHTIFSTSQKLSLSGKMLKMDETNDGVSQLQLLGNILLEGLKK
ncbi:MAG: TetR/AcrR family transcriptional regulator [Treponema sp.]|nr:TetR/AcrR family transcriptional regulator [Treponema sp.]